METLLEQQRRYHEERERLMDAMVQEQLHSKTAHKEIINSEHRQRLMLDRYVNICKNSMSTHQEFGADKINDKFHYLIILRTSAHDVHLQVLRVYKFSQRNL